MAAGMVAATLFSGCSLPESEPFDAAALQELELSMADDRGSERLPELRDPTYRYDRGNPDAPTNYDPLREIQRIGGGTEGGVQSTTRPTSQPVFEGQPTVGLPLSECIRLATLNNFDLAVAGYDPAIAETRIVEALARFDPTFNLTGEYQDQSGVNPAQNQFGDQKILTLGTSLSQLLPSGGQAELSYQAVRSEFDNSLFGIDEPLWSSDLSLRFTQPLLRDFGADVNRARIVINQNDQRISVLDFRDTLEEVLLRVEQTYWQLYRAQQEVQIQQELRDLTIDTARRIAGRITQDADEVQVSQALGEVQQREADLIQARVAVAQLSDQLKGLINDPDFPVSGETIITTVTEPVLEPLVFDFSNALEVALANRPELSQQILRIASARDATNVAQSNRLPRLDAILSSGFEGVDPEYGDALGNQIDFDNVTLGVGLQLEIPIGNRAARAILRRAMLQQNQAVTQYQALVKQISVELSQAQRAVQANFARIARLREARLAATDAVERILIGEELGNRPTPEASDRKLRFLATLAQFRSSEQQAIADYNQSIAQYERAKGTLLRYNNILMAEAAMQMQRPR